MIEPQIYDLALRVGQILKQRDWMLATAESCTGGGISAAVTDVSGSSSWFDRGFVTYSNSAKVDLLGVSELTLSEHGAVSETTAGEMAVGALARSAARIAVAVTGVAGPNGGSLDKPVGTVCFAWATAQGVQTEKVHFDGDRAAIRQQTVQHALEGLWDRLAL